MKKIFFIVPLILFLFANGSQAQDDKRVAKAIKTYEAGEYFNAIDLLKEAYDRLSEKEDKNKMVFYIAQCYRRMRDAPKAELWYSKAVKRGYDDPVVYLHYADALKMNEKYEEALENYEEYHELVPDDPRGELGLKSAEMAQEWISNPTGYIVDKAHFFNSKVNDFAPVYARDDYNVVYFTSDREDATGDEIHGASGNHFSDIFESRKDRKGAWSVPNALGENINGEYSEGASCLSADYNQIYFSRCEKSKNNQMGCYILEAKKDDNEWGKPEEITFKLDEDEMDPDTLLFFHPAINAEGNKLYFSSDMPGGEGALDLWVAEKIDDGWGTPVNLGEKINTPGNEVFPFIHEDGTLYFSSDGHLGMGGLDIYKAEFVAETEWKVQNLGYPMNSSMDDFGIVFQAEEEKGFFTSSRGRRGDDDIYSFHLPPIRFNVIGEVVDEKSNEPVPKAKVKLIGSDGTTLNSKTDEEGDFKFMLKPATDYIFIASADDYLKGKSKATTKGLERSKDIETSISLASVDDTIEIPNIFYDFGEASLRSESKSSLDELVEILNDNPKVTIELMAHTDSRGSKEANIKLSQKRAQSCIDYLVENGISEDRLVAKGYGESQPKTVDESIHDKVPFFDVGTALTEDFIQDLPSDDYKEIAHQINRRTEFRVLSTSYEPED
ncbi:MAG: OmpA family protein [Bacteroidota bacterium]